MIARFQAEWPPSDEAHSSGMLEEDMPLPKPKYKPTFVPLMSPSPPLDGIWPPPGHRGPYSVGHDPSINWQLLAWSWV